MKLSIAVSQCNWEAFQSFLPVQRGSRFEGPPALRTQRVASLAMIAAAAAIL